MCLHEEDLPPLDAVVHRQQTGLFSIQTVYIVSLGGVLSSRAADTIAVTVPLGALCRYTSLLWLTLTTVNAWRSRKTPQRIQRGDNPTHTQDKKTVQHTGSVQRDKTI